VARPSMNSSYARRFEACGSEENLRDPYLQTSTMAHWTEPVSAYVEGR